MDGKGPNSAQTQRKSINVCSRIVKNLEPAGFLKLERVFSKNCRDRTRNDRFRLKFRLDKWKKFFL